jgi:hypothetical protein
MRAITVLLASTANSAYVRIGMNSFATRLLRQLVEALVWRFVLTKLLLEVVATAMTTFGCLVAAALTLKLTHLAK